MQLKEQLLRLCACIKGAPRVLLLPSGAFGQTEKDQKCSIKNGMDLLSYIPVALSLYHYLSFLFHLVLFSS